MASPPGKLHIALDKVGMELGSRRGETDLADEPVAEPKFRELVFLHVQVACSHGADAEVQPFGGIVSDPADDGLVRVAVAQHRMSAVLNRQDVLKLLPPAIKFQAFVHAPKIAQRMRNQRIVDRVAFEVLLTKRNIKTSKTQIQQMFLPPELGDVLEINVQFAQLQVIHEIDLREEINVVPYFRVEEQFRLVHAKLGIAELTLRTLVKKAHPGFAAQDHVFRRKPAGEQAGFGRPCRSAGIQRNGWGLFACLFQLGQAFAKALDNFRLLPQLLLQRSILFLQLPQLRCDTLQVGRDQAACGGPEPKHQRTAQRAIPDLRILNGQRATHVKYIGSGRFSPKLLLAGGFLHVVSPN